MDKEQLLKMYAALKNNPGEIVKAAARHRLINLPGTCNRIWLWNRSTSFYYTLLDKFAHGEIKKMIVQMPPQHGKSEGSSRKLPAFMLGLDPDKICYRFVCGNHCERF